MEFRKSIDETLPKEYKATYLRYDYEFKKFVYQDDFKEYESWSKINDVISGATKLLKMMEIEKRKDLHTVWNSSYLDDNINDIKLLLENLINGQANSNADKVLLVFKYN